MCRMGRMDGMVIIGHRSWTMIVQPRGVPQSYLMLKWQILHFFAPWGPFCGSQRRAPDDGIIFLLRVIPEISGSTRNFGFTRNIGEYPMFWVTRYPMISKTESGRVGYRNKYRVAGRVRVPAGHCPHPPPLVQVFLESNNDLWSTPHLNLSYKEKHRWDSRDRQTRDIGSKIIWRCRHHLALEHHRPWHEGYDRIGRHNHGRGHLELIGFCPGLGFIVLLTLLIAIIGW